MIGKDPLGRFVCDEHPRARWSSEEQAAEHLRIEHPELWDRLLGIEVRPVNAEQLPPHPLSARRRRTSYDVIRRGDVIDTTARET